MRLAARCRALPLDCAGHSLVPQVHEHREGQNEAGHQLKNTSASAPALLTVARVRSSALRAVAGMRGDEHVALPPVARMLVQQALRRRRWRRALAEVCRDGDARGSAEPVSLFHLPQCDMRVPSGGGGSKLLGRRLPSTDYHNTSRRNHHHNASADNVDDVDDS